AHLDSCVAWGTPCSSTERERYYKRLRSPVSVARAKERDRLVDGGHRTVAESGSRDTPKRSVRARVRGVRRAMNEKFPREVGWIGTGRMGYALATRLLEAGVDLWVYNRTRSKAEPLEELGAK